MKAHAVAAAAALIGGALISDAAAASTPYPADPRCLGYPATIRGTHGPDELHGTPDRDVIVAFGGDDLVRGGRGGDLICGGGNDDDLRGGPGGDILDGGPGSDIALGGLDDDDLIGRAGSDALAGEADLDWLFGGTGDDTLFGGPSRDRLTGGADADSLIGGLGHDFAVFRHARRGVRVDLASNWATGEGRDRIAGVEHAIGSAFDDAILGTATRNEFEGGPGDDVLLGRRGRDFLEGGPGADRLDGGAQSDTADYRRSPRPVAIDLRAGRGRGDGADRLVSVGSTYGSRFGDVILGGGGDNYLAGGFGADSVHGGGGDDTVVGEAGLDAVRGGSGDDFCGLERDSAGCEGTLVAAEGYPTLRITSPPPHAQVDSRPTAVRGVGNDTWSRPARVYVAIVRWTPAGCLSWDGRRDELLRRACSDPRWNLGRYAGDDRHWSFGIDPGLPPGRYDLSASNSPSGWNPADAISIVVRS